MSQFSRSVIRGAGFTIGHQLVKNGLPKFKSVEEAIANQSNKQGRPQKLPIEKASNYSIGGRVTTMVGKMFNLGEECEKYLATLNDFGQWTGYGNAWNLVFGNTGKITSTIEYINMKGSNEEIDTQCNLIQDNMIKSFKSAAERIYNSIIDPNNFEAVAINYDQLPNFISFLESSKLCPELDIDKLQEINQQAKVTGPELIKKAFHSANSSIYVYYIALGVGLLIAALKAFA